MQNETRMICEVHRGWLIIAIFGHRSEENLRNYIGPSSSEQRACFDLLSDALSGRPHQSQQVSFMALSSPETFMNLAVGFVY